MQQKIFIGIDLDVHLKKAIVKSLKSWKDLPIKWHKEDGLHIALMQLGWVGEDDTLDVSAALAEFCAEKTVFGVDFTKIEAVSKDPSDTDIAHAQIVRLIGNGSEDLRDFYAGIVELLQMPVGEKNSFRPCVEIGRMRAKKWQEFSGEYPEGEISFPVTMDVSALTLFESVQVDGKRQLVPIEVFELQ